MKAGYSSKQTYVIIHLETGHNRVHQYTKEIEYHGNLSKATNVIIIRMKPVDEQVKIILYKNNEGSLLVIKTLTSYPVRNRR